MCDDIEKMYLPNLKIFYKGNFKFINRKVMAAIHKALQVSIKNLYSSSKLGNERLPKLRFAIGCSYILCSCGSDWLPISKSRLRLPQIVGYLVGYWLFDFFIQFHLF